MNRVIIIIVILFVLLMVMKKTENTFNSEGGNSFIPSFIAWLKKKEGGISKDKDDPAASNSWPDGSHTNIGITKATFEANANRCNYEPTYEVFKSMPADVWWCNYQSYYLKGLKYSDNLVLATYMAQWFWGGWDKSLISEAKVLEAMNSGTARQVLRKLVDLRKQYFEKVVARKPTSQKYLAGWKNKAEDYYNKFSKYL